ncbi:unnamed protein product [Allacma fusca]|uniref:Partial AB-hydrolase lipase domain-containing protein n=1 Tax=Allacma fusca TaxID=39272 RepID=A0A8J2PTC7_9HEXA|nr:unnamed protein product [Allacma fusca]
MSSILRLNHFYKNGLTNFLHIIIFCAYLSFSTEDGAKSAGPARDNTTVISEDDSKFLFGKPHPSEQNTDLPRPDPYDARLNAPQLIRRNGYPVDVHQYVTKDRYLLTLHRIPQPGATPVVVMHGILCSSRDWLLQRGNNSLAYMLYNAGYDVWLGNMRGNNYSQGHLEYDLDDPRYWDFSVDDISNFDVPSTIDYVLATTNHTQLCWIGYSLGTTTLFSGLITNQEYQAKVKCFGGLAPVAYKGNCKSPVIRALADLTLPEKPLKLALDIPSHGRFLPSMLSNALNIFMPHFCHPGIDQLDLCGTFISLVGGFNPGQTDQLMEPIILGEFPSPTSVRVLIQQLQHVTIGAGKFRPYFYQNISKNIDKYGFILPPELDLTKFRVDTMIFAGLNDYLAPPEDVALLVRKLPHLRHFHNVSDPTWNHLDFLYAKQARSLLYDLVIERLMECSLP